MSEDSENIKAVRVNTFVFSLHQIKRRAFFGTPSILCSSYSFASERDVPSVERFFQNRFEFNQIKVFLS